MSISKREIVNIIIIFLLIGSVFVDLYNGYIQRVEEGETFLQYLYKGVVFLISVPFLLSKGKYMRFVLLLLLISLLSLSFWLINAYIYSLKSEIITLSKVFYGYFVLLFFVGNKKYIDKDKLINYVIIYGVFAALSILISYLAGFSLYKYGEDYSFGVQGLFIAGNDLGVALLICNCMSCYMLITTKKLIYILANILISFSSIFLGTVAGIFGTVAIIGILMVSILTLKRNDKKHAKWLRYYLIVLLIGVAPILYKGINIIINIDTYNQNKFSVERLLTGGARAGLREPAADIINSYDTKELLLGKGNSNLLHSMGQRMSLGSTARAIELDQYELIGSYGIVLGGILLLLPIILLFSFLKMFWKKRNPFYLWGSVVLILFLVHAFTAGHAYINVMALQFIAVLSFGYLYGMKKEH